MEGIGRLEDILEKQGATLPDNIQGSGGANVASRNAAAEGGAAEEEALRRDILLSQFLTPEARERLARIGLVKQEKCMQIKELLLYLIKSGRLGSPATPSRFTKITEEYLIDLIDTNFSDSKTSKAEGHKSSVTVIARRYPSDDELDLDQYDL